MYLNEIQSVVKAKSTNAVPEKNITELLIDSRKVIHPAQALFIALKGERRDGHDFIKDAYDKGVRCFMVSDDANSALYNDACFLQVTDTLQALQQLAQAHRNRFKIPVIGITGSNGKTIVKEWLFQLLSDVAPYNNGAGIVRSPKSFNSQIGVPLSAWLMQEGNTLAIFEAGISQPDEMQRSEKIIKPNIGIFTNTGEAHNEGFLNLRQKINEKLKLFRHAQSLIYCKDYHDLHEAILQYRHQIHQAGHEELKLFTWSQKTEATLRIIQIDKQANSSTIEALYTPENETPRHISISIPYTDNAYIENALHCWSVLLMLQIDDETICANMEKLQPVAMRLELRQGINDCTIINDTYNSDLTSLKIALDFLEQQKQHPHKTLILSDMLQIGKPDGLLYEQVADMVTQKNIQRVICIGPATAKSKATFRQHKKLRSIFFKSTEDFLKKLHLITFDNEAILLKGARAFKFEKIEKLLEQKIHKTVLEINLSAIAHNLNIYRSQLQPDTKLMAMVKAFSYGSGSYEIANLLQFEGVDYLAVAYTDEGVALRKAGITLPIMVMSPEAGSFDRMISWKLEPEIFNLKSLQQFTEIAATLNVHQYPVHIKLDTGMHRLGFVEHEIDSLAIALQQNKTVKVASIFSHLVGSDTELLDSFTLEQSARFDKMSSALMNGLGYKPLRHLTNTAGISRHKNLHYDMVRLGIGLYGVDANNKIQSQLQNISTLKTIIAQIKELPAGETVGYSRNGKIGRASRIATVSIGYADGYFRDFGNGKGYMLVNGKPAPVIGSVCMDMCMLDITDIEDVQEGNEVVVFGAALPVTKLATWANTIPYEVMTSISQRVKRVYVNE
jgi:alanine racemase